MLRSDAYISIDNATLSGHMVCDAKQCQIAHCVIYGAEFVTFPFAMSEFRGDSGGHQSVY